MAEVQVDGDDVVIRLSRWERVASLHSGDLRFPRRSVIHATAVKRALGHLSGVRVGTGLPGVLVAGTLYSKDESTFALVRGLGPGVVLDLVGQPYERIVLSCDDPAGIAALVLGDQP